MVLIDALVFAFYRYLAIPLALGILSLIQRFLPAKLQEMIVDRSNLNLQALPARPIWIHAASGEIEYAKSLIRSLKEAYPQIPILVTYFSPSAKKLIQKFPGIDLAMALPWDRARDLEKFLNFYNPRVCLIARTDVWPEMARQVARRKTPSLLFAATFASESSRKGLISGSLTRWALNSLTEVYCVSAADRDNLMDLGVRTPIEVAGDTRFDQVLYRLAHPNPVHEAFKPAETAGHLPGYGSGGVSDAGKIFVCGSTWPQDEDVLLEAFEFWLSRGGRIILAPHEVGTDHISELEKKLTARSWTYQRYSGKAPQWNTQILLVDQVGCLQELYTWGHLAFVGGSFKDKVHSVMEPLCVGNPVVVGPYHRNNREALHFQHVILGVGFFAVTPIQNSVDLQTVMEKSLQAPTPHPLIQQKVQEASGATARLMKWIEHSL